MTDEASTNTIGKHIAAKDTWLRGFFMLVFAVIYQIAEVVVFAIAIFQFLAVLLTGQPNGRLLEFGRSLSRFIYEVMRFFTFNSDDKPFPFAPWPPAEPPQGIPLAGSETRPQHP